MAATKIGYAGVLMTSGTNVGASGKRVNFPVRASDSPSRRYPSWSLQAVAQSGRWYTMNAAPCSAAITQTTASQRETRIARDCTASLAQLAIQRLHVVEQSIDAEPRAHRHARGGAAGALPLRALEPLVDASGQRLDVVGRRQRAECGVADDVANSADVRGHSRSSRRQALDDRDRRPFVARRQQEHVGSGVHIRQVAPPAEESHTRRDAELVRQLLEVRTKLAVPCDEKHRAGPALSDARGHLQKEPLILDRGQASDGRDDIGGGRDAETVAGLDASRSVDGEERLEIESERNDPVLFRGADPLLQEQFVADPRRDRDDAIGRARERALDREEAARRQAAEVALEHVAVIGVHQPHAFGARTGAVPGDRSKTPERAGLGHVRVDDRRTERLDGA